jgi:hypothetical protein
MAELFEFVIGNIALLLSVLNVDFWSLIFVWILHFGAWNFHYFHRPIALIILCRVILHLYRIGALPAPEPPDQRGKAQAAHDA